MIFPSFFFFPFHPPSHQAHFDRCTHMFFFSSFHPIPSHPIPSGTLRPVHPPDLGLRDGHEERARSGRPSDERHARHRRGVRPPGDHARPPPAAPDGRAGVRVFCACACFVFCVLCFVFCVLCLCFVRVFCACVLCVCVFFPCVLCVCVCVCVWVVL